MNRLLIFSHDAGGAEVVASWLERENDWDISAVLEGPAKKIFGPRLPNIKRISLEQSKKEIRNFDFILTGTSWASTLEKEAIELAKRSGVKVASYLDHWSDFQSRFYLKNKIVYPDELWVGDIYAQDIASHFFPKDKIIFVRNRYFDKVKSEIALYSDLETNRTRNGIRILYVCEPTSAAAKSKTGDANAYRYNEFQSLEGYLRYLKEFGSKIEKLKIRPHPSEAEDKYSKLLHMYSKEIPIEVSHGVQVAKDCAWADWVVGCDSMVMALAVYAGKKVFCAIPPGGRNLTLPHPEIIRLFP